MTPVEYEKARRLLMRKDPVLGAAINSIGPCGLAERQRKDHLSALVGAISAGARERDRRCILFTDLDNPTSNSIYRKLGYRAVEEVLRYGFS